MKRRFFQKIDGTKRGLLSLLCLGVGWLALAGCSDRSQEMEERVTQLQRELERVQAQLNAATQNAPGSGSGDPKPGAQSSTATGAGALSSETLQETFRTADAAMRKELEANLRGYRVVDSLMQTVPATDPYPYKSQINLVLVSDGGKKVALSEIPVKADTSGKWVFPTADEVSQQIAARENTDASGANATADNRNARASAPAGEPEPVPRAMMPVNGTVSIQWGDEGNGRASAVGQSSGARQPAAGGGNSAPRTATRTSAPLPSAERAADPAPAAAPSRPPAMPISRDVTVKF